MPMTEQNRGKPYEYAFNPNAFVNKQPPRWSETLERARAQSQPYVPPAAETPTQWQAESASPKGFSEPTREIAGGEAKQEMELPECLVLLIENIKSGRILEEWAMLPYMQRRRIEEIVDTLRVGFKTFNQNYHHIDFPWYKEHGEITKPLEAFEHTLLLQDWGFPFRQEDRLSDSNDADAPPISYPTVDPNITPDSPLYPIVEERWEIASRFNDVIRRVEETGGVNPDFL
jgi:hypothetical protein